MLNHEAIVQANIGRCDFDRVVAGQGINNHFATLLLGATLLLDLGASATQRLHFHLVRAHPKEVASERARTCLLADAARTIEDDMGHVGGRHSAQ